MRALSRRAALASLAASAVVGQAQAQTVRAPSGLRIVSTDYAADRAAFRTRLLRRTSPPQARQSAAPADVEEISYPSGALSLKAWIGRPQSEQRLAPAVVFMHGGFGFNPADFERVRAYITAGFVVLTPTVRGENGQVGDFTMFYDEVDDVIAAAAYLRRLPGVDAARVYLAGHSVGATLTMLAAEASTHFRASASISGSPDQIPFCADFADLVPFDTQNPIEFEMRSPLAYAASFKAPARLFYSEREDINIGGITRLTASVARDAGRDVRSEMVPGNHMTALPEAIIRSIAFFQSQA